jgi:beta-1,4-mannosyl-glycoprotein beta-1,4-N-acetylglucosaminyltransferase
MKVYDVFLFFNELDLLEIRLNLLNDVVDYFVISESDVTFSGKPKPLYYQENKERFKQFEHKIIHQVIRDTPNDFVHLPKIENPQTKDQECLNKIYRFLDEATNFNKKTESYYGRDSFQRDSLHRALVNCNDEDIICFSDVDEIPNPETLKKVIDFFPSDKIYTLRQKEFNYYLNMYKQDGWMGPRVISYGTLKNISLNQIRTIVPGEDRTLVNTVDVPNGGWHFTSIGSVDKIIQKIESWGHQEFNIPRIKDNVKKNVAAGKDIFQRKGIKIKRIEFDEKVFPRWLVQNKEKYSHLISHAKEESSMIKALKRLFNK